MFMHFNLFEGFNHDSPAGLYKVVYKIEFWPGDDQPGTMGRQWYGHVTLANECSMYTTGQSLDVGDYYHDAKAGLVGWSSTSNELWGPFQYSTTMAGPGEWDHGNVRQHFMYDDHNALWAPRASTHEATRGSGKYYFPPRPDGVGSAWYGRYNIGKETTVYINWPGPVKPVEDRLG